MNMLGQGMTSALRLVRSAFPSTPCNAMLRPASPGSGIAQSSRGGEVCECVSSFRRCYESSDHPGCNHSFRRVSIYQHRRIACSVCAVG